MRFAGLVTGVALLGLVSASAAEAACSLRWPMLARGLSTAGIDGSGAWRQASDATLAALAQRGMGHVRVPVKAENLIARFSTPTLRSRTVFDLRRTIAQLRARSFAVVLDMHGGQRLFDLTLSDPAAARLALLEAWRQLAGTVRTMPSGTVFAELLNEPAIAGADWDREMRAMIPAFRAMMPAVPIIVSTGGPQRVEALLAAKPVDDRAVIYAIHYYDPLAFTHQGSTISGPVIHALHDLPFPFLGTDPRVLALADSLRALHPDAAAYLDAMRDRSFDAGNVQRELAAVGAWSAANKVPVVIGEFGVVADKAPRADRLAWLSAVAKAAEGNCLGWTYWSLGGTFGLLDPATGTLDTAAADALTAPAPVGKAVR